MAGRDQARLRQRWDHLYGGLGPHFHGVGEPDLKEKLLARTTIGSRTVVDIPLDELRLPARMVRASDPAHVRDVAGSISALGFCVPVLVGKNNIVLDGAIRIEAARLLGLT